MVSYIYFNILFHLWPKLKKKTKNKSKQKHPNNNHAKLISDRGKIFDTSEIKHSQEHELYTVIKVLRSSMLVQGVASSTNCKL